MRPKFKTHLNKWAIKTFEVWLKWPFSDLCFENEVKASAENALCIS